MAWRLPGLSIFVMLTAVLPMARAELRFTQPSADVGEVRTGTPLVQSFAFTNAGSKPVTLIEARASCGCLIPQVERRTYAPGETATLRLEVNTLTQPAGPNTWTVRVRWREREQEAETTLTLSARLVTEIQVEPAALTIFAERPIAHELRVTDLRPRALHVTAVAASAPALHVRLLDPGSDGHGRATYPICLEVGGDFPEGRHEEKVLIVTDDPAYRELKVPVTIVKQPRHKVTALPAEVRLAAPAGQPVPSRIVLLRDADQRRVVVERVTADDPAIVCQFAAGPNEMTTLKVQVDRNRLRGSRLQTAVHVQMSGPTAETVTIPVSFHEE